jgi:hypothetical protein
MRLGHMFGKRLGLGLGLVVTGLHGCFSYRAQRLSCQMAQPGGMVTEDGKVSPWVSIHQSMTKTLGLLSLRLRIGPQHRALKASKKEVAPISAYDRLRLQKDWP